MDPVLYLALVCSLSTSAPSSATPDGAAEVVTARTGSASEQDPGGTQEKEQLEARIAKLERRLTELQQPAITPVPATRTLIGEATHTTPQGFWAIPGSDLGFKIGGYVKLDAIHDFRQIGNRYKFATQTIAVPGGSDSVSTIHARESRLNFDLRGPVGGHAFRVFVEGDFFGEGGSFELRHAYGEVGRLLAGQTWTTYMDLSSRPHTLDFEGPDGEIFVRQPMVRWTQPLGEGKTLSVALEDSSFDFTVDAADETVGDNPAPDLAANFRLEGKGRHFQLSGLLRYLRLDGAEGAPDESALGWGVALSGKTQFGSAANRLMGQVAYGEGSGRYNQATRGVGSDAVLEATGLEPLPLFTAVAGFEHDWCATWSSTLAMSLARVSNSDAQPTDAIHRSESASVNLVWHPWPRFLVGGEYLYGQRVNRDGDDGDAHRLQVSFKFLF